MARSLYAFLILGFWIQPAMAYVDPASGSVIMSAIIGFFVAVGLAVKTYWYKLKSFFRGNEEKVHETSDEVERELSKEE